MNKKYYTGMDLLEEIKKRNIKEDTKIFNINADVTFIYKNGNLYNCYDNELIGSLLEIVDCEFMILEDNTEEIEEIYVDDNNFIHTELGSFKGRKMDIAFVNKFNEISKAVNKLRKEKE